jgi:hypothetical protein
MTVEWTQEDLRRFITEAQDGCLDGKSAATLEGPESMYLAFAAELWHTFAHLPSEHRDQVIMVYLWNYLKAYHAYPREVAASFYLVNSVNVRRFLRRNIGNRRET